MRNWCVIREEPPNQSSIWGESEEETKRS
uniref:Uncharacterized protein n=1 Tax=Arundo donax TaxID=35708 RepID=A0A0A9DW90_ARUDO